MRSGVNLLARPRKRAAGDAARPQKPIPECARQSCGPAGPGSGLAHDVRPKTTRQVRRSTSGTSPWRMYWFLVERTSSSNRRQQILDPDRQLADAFAGGVVDRIGNGGRGSNIGEFANAFDADRVHLG